MDELDDINPLDLWLELGEVDKALLSLDDQIDELDVLLSQAMASRDYLRVRQCEVLQDINDIY